MSFTRDLARDYIRTCTENFLSSLVERVNFSHNPHLYAIQEDGTSAFEKTVRDAEQSTRKRLGTYVPVFTQTPPERHIDLRFLLPLYAETVRTFSKAKAYHSEKNIVLDLDFTAFAQLNQRINAGRCIGEDKYRDSQQIRDLIDNYQEGNDMRIYELITDKNQENNVKTHNIAYALRIELINPGEEQKVSDLLEKIMHHTKKIEVEHMKIAYGKFP